MESCKLQVGMIPLISTFLQVLIYLVLLQKPNSADLEELIDLRDSFVENLINLHDNVSAVVAEEVRERRYYEGRQLTCF